MAVPIIPELGVLGTAFFSTNREMTIVLLRSSLAVESKKVVDRFRLTGRDRF
jgi:hypothetical protein